KPLQRGTKVVVVPLQAIEALGLARGGGGEREEVGGVPLLDSRGLAARLQHLQGVLADRLQHPEARLGIRADLLQQALRDQRAHAVEYVDAERAVRVADVLGSLEGAAADEDRETPEQRLLLGVEQVVAPGDRASERLLA